MSKNYYYTAQRPLRYFKFYNELLLLEHVFFKSETKNSK